MALPLLLIPAIEVAGAYALRRTLPFTVKKSLELLKRETNLDILTKSGQRVTTREAIPRGDKFAKFSPKEDYHPTLVANTSELYEVPKVIRETAKVVSYTPVKDIPKPFETTPLTTSTTSTSLISVLNEKNKILEEANQLELVKIQLMYSQIEQMEIANELKSSEIFTSIENMTALVTMLYDINSSITLISEAINTGVVSSSEDMGKYFSSVANYFEFMNTGKIGEKEDFFSDEIETVTLKDENDNPIIPREIQVKKDYEKFKSEKDFNDTDFKDYLMDLDGELELTNPFELLQNIFTVPTNEQIQNYLKEGV